MNNFFGNNYGELKLLVEKELKKMFELQEENNIERLKIVFKDKIKISFMLNVLNKIKTMTNNFTNIFKYYPELQIQDDISLHYGLEAINIDICNHITGVHTFNMLLVEEHERGTKQKNQKYIDDVADTVLEQIKIRRLGSMLFRKLKVFGIEDYLYYPPVYNLHVLLVYLTSIMDKRFVNENAKNREDKKRQTLKRLISNIIDKSRSILAVIDYDSLESGYPILRGIIELYITYLALKYSNADINDYLRFSDYKFRYDMEFKMPEEFEEEYDKVGKGIKKIDYLNYGWLDSIFEFEYLGVRKTYNFSELVELVDLLIDKDRDIKYYASNLKVYYTKCHYYTHANLHNLKFPIIYIMDLCKGLGEVLLGIAYEFNKEEKIKLFEGVNIVKSAKSSIDRLHRIREDLDIDQLEKYYKNRKQF